MNKNKNCASNRKSFLETDKTVVLPKYRYFIPIVEGDFAVHYMVPPPLSARESPITNAP